MRQRVYYPIVRNAIEVGLLAVALVCGTALHAQEGWDPLRQVTKQAYRPNLLLVQDVTGSMASDIYDNYVGTDSVGTAPQAAWSVEGQNNCYDNYLGSKVWIYTLTVTQQLPSRITNLKNALGNSVSIYTMWQPPTSFPVAISGAWAGIQGVPDSGNPTPTGGAIQWQFTWTLTSNKCISDPGAPFAAEDSNGLVYYGSGGTVQGPQDLIGQTANTVNWGLEVFSTGYGDCSSATLLVPIDTSDSGNVAVLEAYLHLSSNRGLSVGGGTNTIGALKFAQTVMRYTYAGGTFKDYMGHSFTLPADPEGPCKRAYGVILATDGLSNTCNPWGNDWIRPCGPPNTCPPYCCDSQPGKYDCVTEWQTSYPQYPPGQTEALYNLDLSGNGKSQQRVHTWVVGVSNDVSPCELNVNAYFGRTDATSPNGDAGYQNAADPNLPIATGDTNSYVTGHDYAFFATSASAMVSAFQSIVHGAATGDYSTGAPVVSNNLVNSGGIAYVSSVGYPAMQGHLYAYDEQVLSNPQMLWDAGQMLQPVHQEQAYDTTLGQMVGVTVNEGGTSVPYMVGRNLTTDPRAIYTWDGSGNLINVASYSKVSSLSKKIALPAGFTDNVLDFVKGFDGTLADQSSNQRWWLLGPILNSTAAIIAAPETWIGKSSLPSHISFEQAYASNHPMIMAGSSDGMLHFFDVADGYEIFAILPPDQLANQVALYANYQKYLVGGSNSNAYTVTGEPTDPSQQIYGVASSPRFADVYLSDSAYHSVLLLTEGKGGGSVTAIKVTHPYPGRSNVTVPYVTVAGSTPTLNAQTGVSYGADANYSASAPIAVLWYNTGSPLGQQTWSVPAVGYTGTSGTGTSTTYDFSCVLGSGFQPPSAYGDPQALQLNMQNGQSAAAAKDLGNASSTFLNNQAYGAGVLYDNIAPYNRPNDLLNEGLVADTDGNVWGISPSGGTWAWKLLFQASNPSGVSNPANPIYYTPAVGYYNGYDIYAYASGNFYETSPKVTGKGVTPPFQSVVYVTLVSTTTGSVFKTFSFPISSFPYGTNTYIPATAQITADPLLFIPAGSVPSSSVPVKAYFTFYDPNPDLGCGGASFLVKVSVDFTKLSGSLSPATQAAAYLGSGAVSGMSFSGGKIIVAKSSIGGGQAAPVVTNENAPTVTNQLPGINAWQELQ